jgi:hypothetical protein
MNIQFLLNEKLLLNNTKLQHGHKKFHWHIILKQEGDQFLLLSLSTKQSLKAKNSLHKHSIQKAWNCSTTKCNGQYIHGQSYNCSEKLSWWSAEDIEQSLIDSCSLTDSEWTQCTETLWDDTHGFLEWLKAHKWNGEILSLISKLENSKKLLEACSFWN